MKVEPFALDLRSPLATANGSIEERCGFVVRCDHRGETGVGEATPLPGWTESHEECERALEEAAGRAETDGIAAARRSLPAETPAARHGVSTALLDADARADGAPLCSWFNGGRHPGSVPVNATVGDGSPKETANEAATAIEEGFDCIKVKVGAKSPERDLERLRAVRNAIGDGPTLRVDANGAWSRDEAESLLPEFDSLGVAYVEQPIDAEDLAGHAALRDGPVDVALDESLAAKGVAAVLEADAADVLVLKPMALGGPGEVYAIATRCRDAGVEPVISTTVDAVVARTAAVHVAAAVPNVRPCGLATADRLASDLGPDPAPVDNGEITVPDGPGLGLAEVSVDE